MQRLTRTNKSELICVEEAPQVAHGCLRVVGGRLVVGHGFDGFDPHGALVVIVTTVVVVVVVVVDVVVVVVVVLVVVGGYVYVVGGFVYGGFVYGGSVVSGGYVYVGWVVVVRVGSIK